MKTPLKAQKEKIPDGTKGLFLYPIGPETAKRGAEAARKAKKFEALKAVELGWGKRKSLQ